MKTPLDLYVIDKVLQKRKELNISQAGLAAVLEVSVGFVGQVESKKYETKYSVYQIYLLCCRGHNETYNSEKYGY